MLPRPGLQRRAQAGLSGGVAPGGPAGHWCETGHSVFVLSGRLRYRFEGHEVVAGPGDMLHIPAGAAHRHKPSVPGNEPVRYVLTEFS